MKIGLQKSSSNVYFVYMLRCRDNTIYTGITNDLNKRINAHNEGKGAKYTKGRTPVKCIYYEEVQSKSDALKRELFIKSLSKNKKEELSREELWKFQN